MSDSDEIASYLERLDKEVSSIQEESLKMCWLMRGGLTYEECMQLSINERKLIGKIVKENFETTKKTGLPYF